MARLTPCYIGLGSNLGDRERNLHTAVKLLGQAVGHVEQVSRFYETPPWGETSVETYPYLNAAARLNTRLDAEEVLAELQEIEAALGRARTVQNAPRTIDLDLLFFGRQVIVSDELTVPHPRIALRKFVLVPLTDIDPQLVHPVSGKSIAELLAACQDETQVTPLV